MIPTVGLTRRRRSNVTPGGRPTLPPHRQRMTSFRQRALGIPITVLSGETGELQVSVLAAVGDLFYRACNLSDVPTVVVPEARLVS